MLSRYSISRGILRGTYRLLPEKIRGAPFLERVSERVSTTLKRIASHDEIYNKDYYLGDVEGPAKSAAPVIARSIIKSLKPKRVVDVGCGTGALLEALQKGGCECLGLEYSEAGLAICRERGLDVRRFDLEKDSLTPDIGRFDVAISTEVAEHLPENCADRFVDLLTRLAPVIVFTAAPPGQAGVDHVNLQLPEYWIAKFHARGLPYQHALTAQWRTQWRSEQVPLYPANLMIFSAQPRTVSECRHE